MTNINQSLVNGMLKNISDPKLRETYGNILSGKFPYRVYCLSPQVLQGEDKPAHKPGVLIGYIDKRGKCIDEPTSRKDGRPVAGIETSRDRFDGRKGFRCYCGNWSIQAPEEQPTLGGKAGARPFPPTKDQMFEIQARLQKSKKHIGMSFINGVMEYDGFRVEEIN